MRKTRLLTLAILSLLLGACASTTPRTGEVQRMTPEDIAKIRPVAKPTIPLDEIVALSQANTAPDAIIARLAATSTLYALTPSQIVVLARNGVDQKVIDYMVDAQEKARQATLITQLADRDAAAAAQLAREREHRLALQRRQDHWNWGFAYGPWGPGFGGGWGRGHYYDPFYRRFGPRW